MHIQRSPQRGNKGPCMPCGAWGFRAGSGAVCWRAWKNRGPGVASCSCVRAVLLVPVFESASVGAASVSISLSEGNGDLILTNWLPSLGVPLSGAFGAFLFREIGGNGAFRSIASARSFPIVGQVVGQRLRIGLLEIKLTLRHPEHKIVLQPGCSGWIDINNLPRWAVKYKQTSPKICATENNKRGPPNLRQPQLGRLQLSISFSRTLW